ncbi:MAG: HNH endonuclease signature motif containing protein [Acidobacteriota bacterium]
MRHAFVLREEPDSPYAAPLVPQPSPVPLLPPRPRPSPRPVAPADPPLERSILRADRLALSLRRALERIAVPLARAAAAFARGRAWSAFGFARLNDHARERFDRSGRWVRDLAALGEALAALPALAAALTGEDGGPPLGRVAAHIIGRVASPASLDAWIALARAVPVRVLRDAVKQAKDAAAAPMPPSALQPALGDDPADRSLVRLAAPAPLLAAFDETLELYRSVEGSEASATSFVEALIAESFAGDRPPGDDDAKAPGGVGAAAARCDDTDCVSLRRGANVALVEATLARSTGNRRHLARPSPVSGALALAGASLARLEALAATAGQGGPVDLDAQVRALLALETDLEGRLGRLLAEMAERGAWARLRFAGVGHYAEERLGLARTTAEDRARAARALRRFPLLRAAYAGGRIGLEVTLLVLRIVGDGPISRRTEAAWLTRAEEATVKRLRDEARALGRRRLVEGRRCPDWRSSAPGADPIIGRRDLASGHAGGGSDPPRPLEDADWHASLRREPGSARARILAYGTLASAWADETGALPSPDVFLRLRLPHEIAGDFLVVIESSRRRLADAAALDPWGAPSRVGDDRPAARAARMFSNRSRRVPAWIGLLALLEDFVFTWDGVAAAPRRQRPAGAHRSVDQACPHGGAGDPDQDGESGDDGAPGENGAGEHGADGDDQPEMDERRRRRARSNAGVTLPTAPRGPAHASLPTARPTPRRHGDAIYIRDGWRCSAPGCTSRRNLEDHHLIHRAHQGPDDLSNRTCLCRFHHGRCEHGGLGTCKGTAPLGITWRLGPREAGIWYRNDRRVERAPPD